MKLTQEEFDFCAQPVVEQSLMAARARYNRPLGRTAVQRLMGIYRRVGGVEPPRATNCGGCEIKVKAKVAEWYLADKEEKAQKGKAVVAAEEVARLADEAPKKKTTKKKTEA